MTGSEVKEEVIQALRSWGTDWYGPNPEYLPAKEQAEKALRLFLGCKIVDGDYHEISTKG